MKDGATNWIDYLISLSPVLQTLVLALLIGIALWIFKDHFSDIARRVADRVQQGDDLKTPWLSLERKKELEKLPEAKPQSSAPNEIGNEETAEIPEQLSDENIGLPEEWSAYRDNIYKIHRDYFLVHVVEPSQKKGQRYDIYIYLKKHKARDKRSVVYAEFFFGSQWGNRIFKENPDKNLVGIRTSAYHPFLCVCRITFDDGYKIFTSRYIDFEMSAR